MNAPFYDSRLTLYAATGSAKPKSKPTDKLQLVSAPLYSKADNGALIESTGNRVRYFAYALTRAAPTKVVWQVSRVSFIGFAQNWQDPIWLVASGQVTGMAGEFSIDFGAFASKLGSFGTLQPLSIPIVRVSATAKTQQILYVRAVPVDGRGQCIGDPGEGIRVLYGSSLSIPPSAGSPLAFPSFQLWTTRQGGEPNGQGEYPNKLEHLTEVGVACTETTPHWFQFQGAGVAASSIVFQVSAKPFSNVENWDAPSGLVYSKTYSALPVTLLANYQNTVPIPFHDFGPAASTLKPGDAVSYYVRAVALSTSVTPGVISAAFSETMTVNYYKQQAVTIYQWKTVSVPSYTPTIKVVHYEPVRWEDPNWAHYYTVYRYPKWNELTFNVTDGTSTLYTYAYYHMIDPSMTTDRYEKEVLWKWLAPGSHLQVWDKQENKSWWGELWDGIVSFFTSIVNVVASVVNWASTSFAKLKAGIISFIAANFPLIPDDLRGYLQVALTMLVDSGLASLGIPPSLPNFDQLANGGLDYLVKEGLAAAGVEADLITDAVLSDAKSVIKAKLTDSTNSASPNPLNAPFLHANPRYLYQPAYIDVKVTNSYTDEPSLAGFLNIDTGWDWKDTNITVATSTWAEKPTWQIWADALAYRDHFFNGLRKGYPYYPVKYCIYEPMRDIAIPSLNAGESTTVRVYLKEFTSGPYPFAPQGESVTWDDFTNLYWGATGKADFTVWTSGFNLKPITPATSFDPKTNTLSIYKYDGGPMSETFQTVPKDPYKWQSDMPGLCSDGRRSMTSGHNTNGVTCRFTPLSDILTGREEMGVMDETEKARLAQTLKAQLAGAQRPGPVIPSVRPVIRPDLAPFAIAACAANTHLHLHIDEALRLADPVWNAEVVGSTLVHHPALVTLSTEDAAYACRLVGVSLAAQHDQQARACLGEIMRDGWRRAWQMVSAGESISLERFRAMHPSEHQEELETELVVLTWYAGVCRVPVAETPMREALDQALVRALHRLTLAAAEIDPESRAGYDAALRYDELWWRANGSDSADRALSMRLSAARDVVRQVTQMDQCDTPGAGDVLQAAFLLAGTDAGLDDGTAVSMLTGLFALRQAPATQPLLLHGPTSSVGVPGDDEELRKARADLVVQLREVHRLTGELEGARERLSAREAENSRLMGIISVRGEPEAEVQYTVRSITERVLVAGGHETLSRNLQTWLPNSVCIATNGKEDLDPAVLSTARLVVVLTSYISHAFSGKVINEAHKRDLSILMLDWRSAKHILQEIDRALTNQQDLPAKQ